MHLLVVIVYVYVDYVLGRLYIFSFMLFMYFILIWCVKRYNDTALNLLDKMLTTMLMFFCWLGVYDTINIYSSAKVGEKRYDLHQVSDLLKLMMLFLPVMVLIMCIIKNFIKSFG